MTTLKPPQIQMHDVETAIEEAARDMGCSEEHVRQLMENMIAEGFSSPDPETRLLWQAVPRAGDLPTPEEALLHIASRLIEGLFSADEGASFLN